MGEKPQDLLGLAPYGRAAEAAVKKSLNGIGAFLGAICMPAAEEFGFYLRDHVSSWRKKNAVKMLADAEDIRTETRLTQAQHLVACCAAFTFHVERDGHGAHDALLELLGRERHDLDWLRHGCTRRA